MDKITENTLVIFENIYNKIKLISSEFKINYTYLNTIKMVIDENKINDNSEVAISVNKTMNKLYETCEKYSKKANDKRKVHLFVFREFIDIIQMNIIK